LPPLFPIFLNDRWNYELEKPTWVTQSSANIGDVLDHLKLGLDDGTTPDSLIHKDIGKSVGHVEYRLAFCALPAHLEQVAALVLLLLSHKCVQPKCQVIK
jgi:hypothetical protein